MDRSPTVLDVAGPDAPIRVLIVEHAIPMAALLEAALRREGMITAVAESGAAAVRLKPQFQPDIVLVDPVLPDLDGLSLVQMFARDGDCGVIVVTADDAESARVAGLDTGADDYMVKPAPIKELAARIRAVHRRLNRPDAPVRDTRIVVDVPQRSLRGPGSTVTLLTEAEFAALETLLDADGVSVSREWLGRVALKRALGEDDRSVDQLVLKLRRKLSLHGLSERAILSSRGLGYVIPQPGQFILPATRPALPTRARFSALR